MKHEECCRVMLEHVDILKQVREKLKNSPPLPCSQDMEPELGKAILHRRLVKRVVNTELFNSAYFLVLFLVATFTTGLFAMWGMQNDDIWLEIISLLQLALGYIFMNVAAFCVGRFQVSGNLFIEGGKLLREIDALCKLTDFHKDPKGAVDKMGTEELIDMHRTLMELRRKASKEGKGGILGQNKEPEQ
jgi:hypothetical protein